MLPVMLVKNSGGFPRGGNRTASWVAVCSLSNWAGLTLMFPGPRFLPSVSSAGRRSVSERLGSMQF